MDLAREKACWSNMEWINVTRDMEHEKAAMKCGFHAMVGDCGCLHVILMELVGAGLLDGD
jgi:hypothetical protein